MYMTLENGKLRVLNLEDNPNDSELIQATLEIEWPELELLRVDTRAAFIRALEEFKPDVVLSDFKLPEMNGQEALGIVRQAHPEIPVVMVTGALGDIEAVELIKLGAKDYVMKDHLHRLISAVQGALSQEQSIRARKAMEHALLENEADIRALVEHSPVAMIVDASVGAEEKVVLINRKFSELFGYTLEDLPDVCHWWPLAYPDKEYREKLQAEFEALASQAIHSCSEIKPVEATVTCKDGSLRYVKISLASIGNKNIVTFEDLTEHKQAEAKIRRLSQLYSVLSHCNQAIVRSKDEQELFARICQIAVQFGDFKMAWIGRIDPDTRMIVPLASAGAGAEEYLRDIKISADANSEYGQGPTGSALRENHPVWCHDYLQSPLTAPWHELGGALGWRSSAALPLCKEGVVFGGFTLYASELNAFDEAARGLLIEMSSDINFALDNFKHEAERKQAEKMLHDSSESLDRLLNSMAEGAYGVDNEGNCTFVNRAFLQLLGYESSDELLGKHIHELIHHSYADGSFYPASECRMYCAYELHQMINVSDEVFWRKDRVAVPVEYWSYPIMVDGVVIGAIATFIDITERKRAVAHLRESEEKFRAMTGSAQDGIIMIDDGGNISFWNGAAEKIFGYSKFEVLGEELHQLLTPERFREAAGKGFAHFQHSGEGAVVGKTLELVALHKNGNEFPIELSLSAVNISGRWQAIGIVRDIAERKQGEAELASQYERVTGINAQLVESNKQLEQAQNQLLQSEKLAAIGLLAAGVAHEINNPIGYVNSNLGTLEKYLADIFVTLDKYEAAEKLPGADNPLLEELRQFKKKIDLSYIREDTKSLIAESHEGLGRVKKIILDLKEFSHTDSEDQWVWADVHQGLDSTLNVVWNELKYKCDVVKEYGVLPKIYCLPAQINQVFMNLLVNAAQAIEEHGNITLRTGQESDRIWVEVSDSGQGIPAENIQRLFDPFFTTKPVGKGTGLGLSVSYKIIEKHHGKIEVRSEVGKGSTFRVILPVQQPTLKEKL